MKKNLLKYLGFLIVVLFSVVFFINTRHYDWRLLFRTTASCFKQLITEKDYKIKNYPSKIDLLYRHVKLLTTSNISYSSKDFHLEKIGDFEVKYTEQTHLYPLLDEIFISKDYFFYTKKKKPFIVDCGACIGMSVLFFKCVYPDSQVLAFEPTDYCFNLLKYNVENNNLSDVKLVKKALYNKEGTSVLYGPGKGTGSVDSSWTKADNSETISLTKLSKYITKEVDLLKIDIEGAETVVLGELEESDKLKYIKEIIMEFHYSKDSKDNKLSKLIKILESNNFVYQISSNLKTPFEKADKQTFLIYAYR